MFKFNRFNCKNRKVSVTVLGRPGERCTVRWYTDDKDASGFGENALYCHWEGTYENCRKWAKGRPPKKGWLALTHPDPDW